MRFGIIGVGGFARTHLESLSRCAASGDAILSAAVVRNPDKYEMEERFLSSRGVRVYRSYQEMFNRERGVIDVIAVPGGTDQHEEQSVAAVSAGFNVLCEKPVAGTVAEAQRMTEAARTSGKFIAIGFQNIFSPTIQRIKSAALSGEFGRLTGVKTTALWPRSSAYYARNAWAGKIRANGKLIYDSPVQNATAHFLMNMLYAAGTSAQASAEAVSMYGENYRAKDIEFADTQYVRVDTREGVPLTFMTTHAAAVLHGPITEYVFARGTIRWIFENNGRTTIFRDGQCIETLDNGPMSLSDGVFRGVIAAVRECRSPLCTVENASAHTRVAETLCFSAPVIPVDAEHIERLPVEREWYDPDADVRGAYNIVISGIEPLMARMFEHGESYFEAGAPWARRGVSANII